MHCKKPHIITLPLSTEKKKINKEEKTCKPSILLAHLLRAWFLFSMRLVMMHSSE